MDIPDPKMKTAGPIEPATPEMVSIEIPEDQLEQVTTTLETILNAISAASGETMSTSDMDQLAGEIDTMRGSKPM